MVVVASLRGALPLVTRPENIGDASRIAYLLHAEEEIRWSAPMRAGDELSVAADIVGREDRATGEAIIVGTRVTNQRRELVASTRSTLLIRSSKPASLRALRAEARMRELPPEPTFSQSWAVAADQADRYAAASGDPNPIHLRDEAAREIGLKRRILHGMCTMAFAQRAVIAECCGGDASRLVMLRARFTKPVFPGDVLTCAGWPAGGGGLGFEVRNQDGLVVVRDGAAEVR